jgi:hypothetical protein
MAIRTIQDLMKTHQELLASLRRQTEVAQEGGGRKALPLLRRDRERELTRLQARLADSEEARSAALARHDRQIAQHREGIARLEKELGDLDQYAAGAAGKRRGGGKEKAGAAAKGRRKKS